MRRFSTVPFKGTKEQEAELVAWLEEHKATPGVAMPALQKAQEIEPPMLIYISQKGIVIILGISFPASKASVFTAMAANSNGSRTGFTIWFPWIPMTQNTCAINISSRIPGRP